MERSADWMDQARGNLEHAKADAAGEFWDWACFSAHQAAEMAVKAVFQSQGAVAWGHSVAGLLDELRTSRSVPAELIELAKELDKVYVPARYPDAHPSGSPRRQYTRTEAERLVAHAGQILGFCQGLLPDADA